MKEWFTEGLIMSNSIKVIAFYLPQYHTIPENDAAHGKGFTEWTNVKKANPLFKGHYQPRIPYKNNYYNLLDIEVLKEQVNIAKTFGIHGFCYYHYWFSGGRKLLEKPLEMMLKHSEIDMPYCLCWANENWTKKWDGGNNEVIISQDYGDEEDVKNHVDYLCEFFSDKRYIRIDDAPLLVIYKPEIIPNLKKHIKIIRQQAKKNGFDDIKIAVQYPTFFLEGYSLGIFDYYIQFQPRFIQEDEMTLSGNRFAGIVKRIMFKTGNRDTYFRIKRNIIGEEKRNTLIHRDYDHDWNKILKYKVCSRKMMAGAFVDWDNTPRNKKGLVYDGADPNKFKKYFQRLLEKVNDEYYNQFIFINAWNEWGEGCYLEPDQKFEFKYLQALKDSLEGCL